MFSQEDDGQGVALGVVFGIIALVIALVIGLAIHKTGNKASAKPAAVVAAPAAADAASVKVENGVVKFYFASGKAEVAAGAADALADVVKGVAAGKKAVVSGFHDSTGDPARNAELAKERALAVRAALQALGVGEDRVELKKPEEMQASGPNAEARRVEVTIED